MLPESESNTPENEPATASDTAPTATPVDRTATKAKLAKIRNRGRWAAALVELIGDPARAIAYMMAVAVIAAVFLRFQLPGEFWAAFTGIVSGIAGQARHHKNHPKDDDQ